MASPPVPEALASVQRELEQRPRRWLVTGSAGFIGSHLIEALLNLGQDVVSVDNFSTGYRHNLDDVRDAVGEQAWRRHRFIEGDIVDLATCRRACTGADVVLHQAALGSVPRSIEDPLLTHASNATGCLNMLVAARDARVKRFVYAGSSATYGDHPGLPKLEDAVGKPLSPYAVTKHLDELYAQVFGRCYGMETIGLRYFNVFGARQDPQGAYAAVLPRWIDAMLRAAPVVIHGDGDTTRDFCPVANVVQANLLAATVTDARAINEVFNVAVGGRTTLNAVFGIVRAVIQSRHPSIAVGPPVYADFRPGDIRHSQADIARARDLLGYQPTHDVHRGLAEAIEWYETRGAGAVAADARGAA